MTLDSRSPVASVKIAIALVCSGNSFNNRDASSRVNQRSLRLSSLNLRICGTLSIQPHFLCALLRIDRTNSVVRFTRDSPATLSFA